MTEALLYKRYVDNLLLGYVPSWTLTLLQIQRSCLERNLAKLDHRKWIESLCTKSSATSSLDTVHAPCQGSSWHVKAAEERCYVNGFGGGVGVFLREGLVPLPLKEFLVPPKEIIIGSHYIQ